MIIELAGGPRNGEWIDTQDLPSWDVDEFPTMRGCPVLGDILDPGGKYVRTDRMVENRVVFEYAEVK